MSHVSGITCSFDFPFSSYFCCLSSDFINLAVITLCQVIILVSVLLKILFVFLFSLFWNCLPIFYIFSIFRRSFTFDNIWFQVRGPGNYLCRSSAQADNNVCMRYLLWRVRNQKSAQRMHVPALLILKKKLGFFVSKTVIHPSTMINPAKPFE